MSDKKEEKPFLTDLGLLKIVLIVMLLGFSFEGGKRICQTMFPEPSIKLEVVSDSQENEPKHENKYF